MDLTDYTLYFNSYHYEFELNDNKNKVLIENDDIIIELVNNQLVINQEKKLNFSNNAQFNEIDIITKPITTPIPIENNDNQNKRRLLWNKWDHTTKGHEHAGRFVGDPSKARTFNDAKSLCREYYGDIASVRTDEENKEYLELCKKVSGKSEKTCWIGLTAPDYEWEDGNYVTWSNWIEGKPDYSIDEKCTRMQLSDGKWDDYPCNRQLYAICEKAVDYYIGNFVVVTKQTTREKAARYCKYKFQSTLATIHTATDAIQAHEACKKAAKAPHGCWIGLTDPFQKFDNGIEVKEITPSHGGDNLDWAKGKKPGEGTEGKCTEIDKDGYWRPVPCDYERHILCNVAGTGTATAEQDQKYLEEEKKAEEDKKKKEESETAKELKGAEEKEAEKTGDTTIHEIKEEEYKYKQEQGTQNHEFKEEKETEEEKKKEEEERNKQNMGNNENNVYHTIDTHVDPNSPIEKQIEALKKILAEQQSRLESEKKRFGVEHKEHLDHLNSGNTIVAHNPEEEKTIKGFQEAIHHFQTQMDANQQRRQESMQQRMQQANPFGGAFGGSLKAPAENPYNGQVSNEPMGSTPMMGSSPMMSSNPMMNAEMMQMAQMMQGQQHAAPPPVRPMDFMHYISAMQRVQALNPLRLPTYGLQGRYADRRRMIQEKVEGDDAYYEYKAIKKCFVDIDHEICIKYDWENDLGSVDANVYDRKIMRDRKRIDIEERMKGGNVSMNIDYNVYRYGRMDDVISEDSYYANHIQYFLIYEFDFNFSLRSLSNMKCQYFNNDEDKVCIIKGMTDIILYYYVENMDKTIEKTFNYNIDEEWDEVYVGQNNKKCINSEINTLCLIKNDTNDYKLEIKIAITNFEKFKH